MDKLSDADVDRLINGGASADNASSEQKAADDWLAAFAKKSQEALARRDAEQKAGPRPDDKVLIERLARKELGYIKEGEIEYRFVPPGAVR